ncbi:MAG TPA: cell division topological specificity factor MinE [Burkholderiales bacterium]|nr:cell division topological specificity factor MinE [Burkholderiales bacterium]
MSILDYLFSGNRKSAKIARERLQIILAHEHSGRSRTPDYLPAMKQEIMAVIAKYIEIDQDQIRVNLDRQENYEVLELNIILPEPKS